MEKLVISGIEIEIAYDGQVINMGGPGIGTMSMDGNVVSDNCIVNNFVFYESKRLLFFVKYHLINNYYYFTINFYNIVHNKVFEFEREFEIVYIKQFINANELEIFLSFHDQFPYRKQIFYLDQEGFSVL